MIDTSQYQVIIWRTWLDRAKTKPVYEAHVLFDSDGNSCIGQGSTPNRAEKDARKALASILEEPAVNGYEPQPMQRGQTMRLMLSDEGDLERCWG